MKKYIVISLLFILSLSCTKTDLESAKDDNYSQRTLREERLKFKNDLIHNTIENTLQKPLSNATEEDWLGAFWGMGLSGYTSETTDSAVSYALHNIDKRSPAFQRALLEAVYTVYPAKYSEALNTFAQTTQNPKLYAMAVNYILDADSTQRLSFMQGLEIKFPDWQENPILTMLHFRLTGRSKSILNHRPALNALLNHDYNGKTVVFSFQRRDRRYPGLAVIRKEDGSFVRDSSGKIFAIKQLAMAVSNMPGYITNGNTPQGVLSMQGFAYSQNVFIGPSLTLQLVMPYEASADTFFHHYSGSSSSWTRALYRDLLPESWQDYFPMYESFYAGSAGRTEIIAHGTSVNPEFYAGKSYYPFTPSLGCLTAYEIWDEESGRSKVSHQKQLTAKLQEISDGYGYFIVVELDDKKTPVQLSDVQHDLLVAEDSL